MQGTVDEDITQAISDGPEALLQLLDRRLRTSPGFDLFTILIPGGDGDYLERVYSTNEAQYPLGVADKVEDNVWFARLFSDREAIVANTLDEIAIWLPDYQIFVEQNYSSLLNLPVAFGGETIGLINMMGDENHFTERALSMIRRELPLATLTILGLLYTNSLL